MQCKLKDILEERMIQQSALAKRVGIAQGTLSLIINGKSVPTLQVAMRIAKALDLWVEDIWVLEDDK